MLNFFYGMVLKSERGTLGLWSVALDAMHQLPDTSLPTIYLRADQPFKVSVSEDLTRALQAWQQGFAKEPELGQRQDFEYEGVRLWLCLSQALAQDYQLGFFQPKVPAKLFAFKGLFGTLVFIKELFDIHNRIQT